MKMRFRKAEASDVDLYFNWANDATVRRNSYQQEAIPYADHVAWFNKNVSDESQLFLIFYKADDNEPVGQVRFTRESPTNAVIGISIDQQSRGQGLATGMLTHAAAYFHEQYPGSQITAYIKEDNLASIKSFTAAGFIIKEKCNYKNIPSVRATKYDQDRAV